MGRFNKILDNQAEPEPQVPLYKYTALDLALKGLGAFKVPSVVRDHWKMVILKMNSRTEKRISRDGLIREFLAKTLGLPPGFDKETLERTDDPKRFGEYDPQGVLDDN